MSEPIQQIWCKSIFGAFNKQRFVEITFPNGQLMQITPAEARDLAGNILATAEASDMDAMVISFLQDRLGQTIEAAAAIIADLREYREKLEGGEA